MLIFLDKIYIENDKIAANSNLENDIILSDKFKFTGQMKILSDYRNDLDDMNYDRGPEMQDIEQDVHNNMRQRWSKN